MRASCSAGRAIRVDPKPGALRINDLLGRDLNTEFRSIESAADHRGIVFCIDPGSAIGGRVIDHVDEIPIGLKVDHGITHPCHATNPFPGLNGELFRSTSTAFVAVQLDAGLTHAERARSIAGPHHEEFDRGGDLNRRRPLTDRGRDLERLRQSLLIGEKLTSTSEERIEHQQPTAIPIGLSGLDAKIVGPDKHLVRGSHVLQLGLATRVDLHGGFGIQGGKL